MNSRCAGIHGGMGVVVGGIAHLEGGVYSRCLFCAGRAIDEM